MKNNNLLKPQSKRKPPISNHLWRFIDLYKFLGLLNSQELFFAPLSSMNDPFEGANLILSSLIKINLGIGYESSVYAYGRQEVKESKDRCRLYVRSLRKTQRRMFATCFYESGDESTAMWNSYSNSIGIAVCFDSNAILANIQESFNKIRKSNMKLYYGNVEYDNLINPRMEIIKDSVSTKNLAINPFLKDKVHVSENEYRFIIYQDSVRVKKFYKISIDLDSTIKKIVAHPRIEDWQYEELENLLKGLPLYHKLKKSEIVLPERLKKHKL